MHGVNRLAVVRDPRIHRANDRNVIDHPSQVRQQLGDFRSARTLFGKLPRRAKHLGTRLSRVVVLHLAGELLPVEFVELRLGIEQVHLARPALHEHRDHRLGPRRKARRLRLQVIRRLDQVRLVEQRLGIRGQQPLIAQQCGQSNRAQAKAAASKKLTAGKGKIHVPIITKIRGDFVPNSGRIHRRPLFRLRLGVG